VSVLVVVVVIVGTE
jgi:hypothetical protein